ERGQPAGIPCGGLPAVRENAKRSTGHDPLRRAVRAVRAAQRRRYHLLHMVSTMNLHSLNLDFCENLVSFITLPPTPRLSYLSARNSGIATLMGMPTMNRLTTLDITNTRITKLDCGGAMPRLQSLFMGNTPVLTFEDAPVFEDLRVLTFQPDMLNPMGRLSFVKFAQSHPDMFYSFASDDRHNDSDSDEDL
ncbi:uncharacterized protein BJ171DRAFT_68462, partial [Polychytrium aggregatum]|uniref:uncharacterized protein n=1 Tax=Polychytrium aggregatum TaxID=110093 RepID=UPI0022FE0A17